MRMLVESCTDKKTQDMNENLITTASNITINTSTNSDGDSGGGGINRIKYLTKPSIMNEIKVNPPVAGFSHFFLSLRTVASNSTLDIFDILSMNDAFDL